MGSVEGLIFAGKQLRRLIFEDIEGERRRQSKRLIFARSDNLVDRRGHAWGVNLEGLWRKGRGEGSFREQGPPGP